MLRLLQRLEEPPGVHLVAALVAVPQQLRPEPRAVRREAAVAASLQASGLFVLRLLSSLRLAEFGLSRVVGKSGSKQ